MKRELAFSLGVQTQLSGSLGRTRRSKVLIDEANGVSEGFSEKRLNSCDAVESELDGSADQACPTEFRVNGCNGVSGISGISKFKRLKRSSSKDGLKNDVENLISEECGVEEESKSNPVNPVDQEDPKSELVQSPRAEGGTFETPVWVDDDTVIENALLGRPLRRFTRSALKLKVEPAENLASVSDGSPVEDGAKSDLKADEESKIDMEASETPKKNLELKMSKKIAVNKVPSTVRELLETGLLEGLLVTYMGGKKGSRLQGTIKDVGILCSCEMCNGGSVMPPSQFERHACNAYRRACQYICLENGKSLLQVLKACRETRLDTLEATILNAIGSFPEKESMSCQDCKGSLPPSVAEVRSLSDSCTKLQKSEDTSTHTIAKKARSPKQFLTPKSSKSALVRFSSNNKSQRMIPNKLSKLGLSPKSSKSDSLCNSSNSKSQWRITKKDQRLHKLVFEEAGLPDGTELAYYARGQKLLEGYKKGSGIFCLCCNCEVSPSLFEAHAGCASRRKPYQYIYTSNGVSLHELSLSLSKGRKFAARDNDDLCIICADGGNLLLCDGCPRAFHKECASLSSIPRGDWYCKYCQNMFQRERFVAHNANAIAAGRVSGVDPIEQITKRCIRIVKNPEAEVTACSLCRGYDFSRSGFDPRTVILCDQCEKEYHVGCLKDYKMANLEKLPKGKWFCCMDCKRIHSTLQKLLDRGAEKLPDSLLNVIKKKYEEKGSDSVTGFDVRWRLLSGKIASSETRLLLSKAVAIFHDCFDPIVDSATGRDLIPSMVYGRSMRGQEFGGMYCAVLTVNSTVVSTGILRVLGREVAELPLVATSNDSHGKGYFQTLFSCIERLLAFLNIENFLLPAAEEAESIWTEKFGFKRVSADQLSDYRNSCIPMTTFKGTSMLQKMVPKCRVIQENME